MIIKMKDGKEITVKDAIDVLKLAMQTDDGYAWGWHCNIAMMAYDAGTDHKIANDGAARFMNICFDVDTSEFKEYKQIME